MKNRSVVILKRSLLGCVLFLPLNCMAQGQMGGTSSETLRQQQENINNPPPTSSIYDDLRVQLSPYAGASSSFIKHYQAFSDAVANGDTVGAAAALDKLQTERDMNQYEATYLSLARFRLAEIQGTPAEQMQHLQTMFDTADNPQEVVVLPEELETMARRALLKLQVQNNYLREAMGTYELLQQNGDTEIVATFDSAMAQIQELAGNDVAYPVAAQLDDKGQWHIGLHKRQFYIDEVTGKVAEAELACEEKSQTLAIEPLIGYKVPAALGDCTVNFTGDPGTRFVLTQFRE